MRTLVLAATLAVIAGPAYAADEPREVELKGPIMQSVALTPEEQEVVEALAAAKVTLHELQAGNAPKVGEKSENWFLVPKKADVTYAEAHPIVTAPTRVTWKGVVKAGKVTRLNKIGRVIKKAGVAASDGFVAFGRATEKYHPGLQTLGYLGQIITPIALPTIKK